MTEPSYLDLYRTGRLKERVEQGLLLAESCSLCPRECGVNRLKGEKGFCGTGRRARVASYNAHFGEEAPLVGCHGSGTIFVSSCNLLCSFCQNHDISHGNEGVDVEPEQMAAMMIELATGGCHNINVVTPTHVVPQLLEALLYAIPQGLSIPLVYNSSGYDKQETLALLEGVFDIYMPDFKFWDGKWAERYCRASRGLLVRHLVMPHGIGGTREIMEFLAKEISPDTYVNVMDQYRPCGAALQDEFINRSLTGREFREAKDAARKAGLKRLDPRERIRLVFGF
jgi:putative pyruvate formate lyase activating enzyme